MSASSVQGEEPIQFASSVLSGRPHICGFFSTSEEEYQLLLPFVIMGVLRTHPMVILGGVLQENPFFIPPEQFLQELRERRVRNGLQPAAN